MKTLKPYRVKSAYSVYRKGDIIFPTGMLRDELIMCGRIEPVPVVVPEPEPEPAPVEDITDDEPDPLVETATEPEPETAARGYGRRSRR
jgi:hypothetical protein